MILKNVIKSLKKNIIKIIQPSLFKKELSDEKWEK